MNLAVVTATTDLSRSRDCRHSWSRHSAQPLDIYVVANGVTTEADPSWREGATVFGGRRWIYTSASILGVVPAFAIGVQKALEEGAEVIACLHDDLLIEHEGWPQMITDVFAKEPQVGLVGFGGGVGLADEDIYRTPYDPMQLARKDFVSNMRDAESHGRRVTTTQRVACLDGFSQVGRREFWRCLQSPQQEPRQVYRESESVAMEGQNLFRAMAKWGLIHHAYDAALGAFAKRLGWEVWMLPVACHHYGGQTAVADPRYHAWANQQGRIRTADDGYTQILTGDQAFWHAAHRIVYDQFRDQLPIRL